MSGLDGLLPKLIMRGSIYTPKAFQSENSLKGKEER